MPDNHRKNPWNRLVDAARNAGATEDHAPNDAASSGFVARVITMREGLWRLAKTLLWRRWSLVAALIAIALYLILYFVMKSIPPASDPVPTPSLPLPPEP